MGVWFALCLLSSIFLVFFVLCCILLSLLLLLFSFLVSVERVLDGFGVGGYGTTRFCVMI